MKLFEPKMVRSELAPMSAADTATGSNADAVITYPAVVGECHAIAGGIAYSYGGTGTLSGGTLTVAFGGVSDFVVQISAKGAGFVPYSKAAPANTAVTITLAAGGASVTGYVNNIRPLRVQPSNFQGEGGELNFGDYADSGGLLLIF